MDNNLNEISKIKDIKNPRNSPNETVSDASDAIQSKMSEESLPSTPNSSNQLPSFRCTQCSYHSIWKQYAVERHRLKHFKNEHQKATKTTGLRCVSCSYTTDSQIEFRDHLRVHNQSIQKGEMDKNAPKTKVIRKRQSNLKSKGSSKSPSDIKNTKRPYQRGKYANVPVKTTKDGFFQCEYCTYQTAIRSAVVIHQIRHEKKESC